MPIFTHHLQTTFPIITIHHLLYSSPDPTPSSPSPWPSPPTVCLLHLRSHPYTISIMMSLATIFPISHVHHHPPSSPPVMSITTHHLLHPRPLPHISVTIPLANIFPITVPITTYHHLQPHPQPYTFSITIPTSTPPCLSPRPSP
ncbi:uncharacterized protein [Haliotis asinina]|uniref:uncharacterized protein n=1 Tax=Haliotis asinina TaxID=109174 RepID=UPI0035321427